MKKLDTRIKHKHDIPSKWSEVESTFIPLAGELIIYDVDDTHNYPRFKVGDGSTFLQSLPFFIPETLYSAEENQNAFSNVKIGDSTLVADTKTDTLNIAEGEGIDITADVATDKITINNAGVREIATGSVDGTISVNTGGTSTNVAVKGLGSAAYTSSSSYAPYQHSHNYAGSDTAGGAANSVKSLLKVGSKTYDGSSEVEIVAADLGLAQAIKFIGSTTSEIFDGSTQSTILVDGKSVTVTAGNVLLHGGYEYVWTGTQWEQLGQEGSFSLVGHKHAAADITSGTLSSDRLPTATASTKGGVKIGGNIAVSDGTISLTANNIKSALGYTPASRALATEYDDGLMSMGDKSKLDLLTIPTTLYLNISLFDLASKMGATWSEVEDTQGGKRYYIMNKYVNTSSAAYSYIRNFYNWMETCFSSECSGIIKYVPSNEYNNSYYSSVPCIVKTPNLDPDYGTIIGYSYTARSVLTDNGWCFSITISLSSSSNYSVSMDRKYSSI